MPQTKRSLSKSHTSRIANKEARLSKSHTSRRESHTSRRESHTSRRESHKQQEADALATHVKKLEKSAKIVNNQLIKYAYSSNFTTLMQLAILHRVQNKCKISPLVIQPPPYKAVKYQDYITTNSAKIAECIRRGANVIGITVYIIIPGDTISHTNMLVYNVCENAAYLYEPHGAHILVGDKKYVSYLDETVKTISTGLFRRKNARERPQFTYHPPEIICPNLGLQHHENRFPGAEPYEGFCSIWICFYLDMVLSYPHLGMAEIHDIVMLSLKEKPQLLFRLIFGYIAKIKKEVDAYIKLFPSLLNAKNDIYADTDVLHMYNEITPDQ